MHKILVTGGAGFIGSHAVVELLENNYEVVIFDNFCNSNRKVITAIEKVTSKSVSCYEGDLKNKKDIEAVFEKESIEAVIHFAAHKAVGESVEVPLKYYENNISGFLNLLSCMSEHNVKNLVFSSSATVYLSDGHVPFKEEDLIGATNPYGRTKIMSEDILRDLTISDKTWNIISLRYFNPLGAHPSGDMGEQPNGIPNNLVPYVLQVAIGKLDEVKVFGDDYETKDGTGIRDYVHIMDLAFGHVSALNKLFNTPQGSFEVFNLGSGKGYSVFEIINNFEKVIGKKIPYKIIQRRAGDIATSYASTDKAADLLDWKAQKDIEEMCTDAWKWQQLHPDGY